MAKKKTKKKRTVSTSTSTPPSFTPIDPRIPSTVTGIPTSLKPLGPRGMQQSAYSTAISQTRPEYDALEQNAKMAESAHQGRVTDIGNWGQMTQTSLAQAFQNTRDALNQLVAVQGGVDKDSQAALVSALNSGGQRNADLAAQLGVTDPSQ